MKCPIDGSDLTMSERQGIEIDYCPKCRGVWLDRGELDKIIERSATEAAAAAPPVQPQQPRQAPYPPQPPYPQPGYPPQQHYGDRHHGHGHHKRRKSWLEDIFD